MAVYYKFKSAKDYDSIALDGPFISVANLKERIFESKHLGRGTDFDLVVTNAQTNEEYLDEEKLIPKNTSVLIRRVPRRLGMPIVAQPDEPKVENKLQDDQLANSNFTAADSSVVKDLDAFEWEDEFGHDLYATIPEVMPSQSSNPIQDAPPPSKADEDSKIKAFVESSALDWQRQSSDGFGPGRGFMRGGRMMGGRSFGRGFERKTPPPGYVCHRCKVPGHFIQHCPTNGDPNYDVKKVKPPTGIPKSMLVATPDGSYALPSGAVAVMRPNEAAFEKEIEGLPSTRSVGDLPPEFRCPLCKEVMKDAVLTSKCCFKSFCDKCIRDYIISNSMCVCGARDILADDLLPNKTLRDTISRILESTTSSAENASSAVQVQDMESARIVQPKIPSPCQSAASKGEQIPPPPIEQAPKPEEIVNEVRPVSPQQSQQQASEKMVVTKVPDVSEATRESASVKEAASQGSAPPVEEEVQQKVAAGEAGDADLGKKKKKKKKAVMPPNAAEMQWRGPQDFAAENYMMPMGPSGYDPYWNGMQQPAMDAFMGPFPGAMPYNMGYGLGPMDMPFGGVIPQDPFAPQGFMFPPMVPPPQRDLALEFGMGMNVRPPLMTRDQFESRKADLRKKREMERRAESMELSKDREYKREASKGADLPPMKPKPKPAPQRPPSEDRYDHDRERDRDLDRHRDDHRYQCRSSSHSHRSDRLSPDRYSRDLELPRPSLKRKSSERRHHEDDDYDYDYDRHRDRDRDRDRDLDRRHRHHHHRRSSDPPGKSDSVSEPQPSKPMSSADLAAAESKKKASVFSRISFPEKDHSKKRKVSSSEAKPRDHDGAGGSGSSSSHRAVNGHHDAAALAAAATVRKSAAAAAAAAAAASVDYESSDDDRHFKRKPSRYQPSAADEEEGRHSKRDRGGHKHR